VPYLHDPAKLLYTSMAPAAKAGGKELEELIVEMIEQTFQKMFN
jgi:hypothetical protein